MAWVAACATVLPRSGLLFLLSCALFAIAGHRSAAVAVGLVLTAVVVHSPGELYQTATAGGRHDPAPPDAMLTHPPEVTVF